MAEPLLIQPGEKILPAFEFLSSLRQLGGLATKGIMAQLLAQVTRFHSIFKRPHGFISMSSFVARFDTDLPEAAVIYLLPPIESCIDSKATNFNQYVAPEGGISFAGDVYALG